MSVAAVSFDSRYLIAQSREFFPRLATQVKAALLEVPGGSLPELDADLPTAQAIRNAPAEVLVELNKGGVSGFAPSVRFADIETPARLRSPEPAEFRPRTALADAIEEFYLRLRDAWIRNPEFAMLAYGVRATDALHCVHLPIAELRSGIVARTLRIAPRVNVRQLIAAQRQARSHHFAVAMFGRRVGR